jgi:hypothetical protein
VTLWQCRVKLYVTKMTQIIDYQGCQPLKKNYLVSQIELPFFFFAEVILSWQNLSSLRITSQNTISITFAGT